MKLYDLEIDLSSGNGGVPRDSFKDWMRVRLSGHSEDRALVVPVVTGSAYFHNAGDGDVTMRRGGSVPVRIGRGEWALLFFDGTPNGMWKMG